MKRILLIMTLLLAGFAAWAGEPYCCTTPGRTLVYERTKANGRIERTVTMEYTAVRRSGTKRLVDCILTVRGPGGAELCAAFRYLGLLRVQLLRRYAGAEL